MFSGFKNVVVMGVYQW